MAFAPKKPLPVSAASGPQKTTSTSHAETTKEMSGFGFSRMSGFEHTALSEWDAKVKGMSAMIAAVTCILLLSVIAIILFFVLGYKGGSQADSDETVGSADTDKPFVPSSTTTERTTATPARTAPTETIATTPTTPVPMIRELVCTVGAGATAPYMYPPDGLCHYLYYTHVSVVQGRLRATEVAVSFNLFKDVVKDYRQTEGGLGFDVRYTNLQDLRYPAVLEELRLLRNNNVQHYGLLNVLARTRDMKSLLASTRLVLQRLKSIQGNTPNRKTVLALGLFNYTEDDGWNRYKNWVREATRFDVDTVIAISTTTGVHDPDHCEAAPPDVLRSDHAAYPTFERHAELVTASFEYENRYAVVGLSMEMGARFYWLLNRLNDIDQIAYANCSHGGLTSQDLACAAPRKKTLESTNVGVDRELREAGTAILWDSRETMLAMMDAIRNLPIRRRLSWLVFNLHFEDFTDQCGTVKFERITMLKSLFGIDDTSHRGGP